MIKTATRPAREGGIPKCNRSVSLLLAGLVLLIVSAMPAAGGDYRSAGYMYLSPLPGAEYCAPGTMFILVRFQNISPAAVTNQAQFIQVSGFVTGVHAGQTKVASDGRTVIFSMSTTFSPYELVTVSLNPLVAPGTVGVIGPFQYQFMVSGPISGGQTNLPPNGTITARGDNPPNETKERAFDGYVGTKWLDFTAPNGTGNFSWIQYVYPTNDSRIVVQYSITSANDVPGRDPKDWHFYGVDGSNNLTLLDTRTNQSFPSRFQTLTFPIDNTNAYRGYRLEITRIPDPTAGCVQLSELQFFEPNPNPVITARDDNPPNETKDKAFDNNTATKWLDPIDPNGTSNFSWIQYVYPGIQAYVVNRYSISSANDFPVRDPQNWQFYGVSGSGNLTLLDAQTNQVFTNRFLTQFFTTTNTRAFRGYRLQITRVADPTTATCVQLSELSLIPTNGAAPVLVVQSQPQISKPAAPSVAAVPAVSQAQATQPNVQSGAVPNLAIIMPNAVSIPSDFPRVNITVNNNPDPEYIFMDDKNAGVQGYDVIFDNNGSPIWYRRVTSGNEQRDLKVQHNGVLTVLDHIGGIHFNVFDKHYQQFTNYASVNGYSGDDHELQVMPDGTYFLLAMNTTVVDMTRFVTNGNPGASVTEEILQQFSPQGDLIFQWRAWDYFDIRDESQFIDLTSSGFDFPHMNAIDIDTDGNILISSRNTSEITKINRDTGDIIWRLGGGHNQFTYVNDLLSGTRNQHAVRCVGTNHYTIFDNGNLHSPSMSRGVEYAIDTNKMTATVVWQYPQTPTSSIYSFYMGNVQRLTNGNTLINWAVGNLPKLTEVRPDGTKAFEMNWVGQWETYRVWRCPWQGSAIQPYLITEAYPDNLTLIFNQFGDTNVAFYRIYGDTAPQSTNLLATSGVTLKKLSNLQNGSTYYFRVTAVNKQGVEGQFSNEATNTINIIKPGQNMVQNADFSQGTASWIWTLSGGATAAWAIESGVSHFYITNGTSTLANIQLKQTEIPLVQSNKYVFQFDAWATSPRYIQAIVAQDASPNQNYCGIASTYVTPVHNHFRYVFTMNAATDLSASVFFNVGSSSAGVYVDNVSLFNPPPGDLNQDGRVDLLDLKQLTGDWLKPQGGLSTDLDGSGRVDLNDFGIFGDNWTTGQ
jgi:hypothetical protein